MSDSRRSSELAEWINKFHTFTKELEVDSSPSRGIRRDEIQVQLQDLKDKITELKETSDKHRSRARITIKEYRLIEALTAEYSIKLDNINCVGRPEDTDTKSGLLHQLGSIDGILGDLKNKINT